jgi:putative endonuclease
MWYVYILQCKDSSFYTGISENLQNRLDTHNSGKGSNYTKVRRPVQLLYCEEFEAKSQARLRELEIKNLSAENKIKLIKFGSGKRFPSA